MLAEFILEEGGISVYYRGKKITTQHTMLKASQKFAKYLKGQS